MQPDLFGFENPTAGEELTKVPRHTGVIVSKDWERVQAILQDYVSDLPVRLICTRHRVGHNTLSRLVEMHVSELDTIKKRVGKKLRRIANIFLDRLELEGHHIPIGQVGINMGIVLDKLERVEMGLGAETGGVKEAAVTPEALDAMLDRMKRAKVAATPALGQVAEVESEVSNDKSQ